MFDIVKNDLEKLEEILLEVVSSPVPLITEIGTHLVKAGGKRLRPALYFLANCKVARTKNIMDLAVALELIHMATLVHDDVVDKAATRRGIITANAKWGNQISVLTGDYLFSKAFSLVAQNPNSRIMSVLTDLICAMSEGEIIQNQEIFVPEMEESVYFTKIAKKTADFIAASCELGAIMAELSTDEVEALRQYGYCIGMAFQITDDILDITATTEKMGKPVGNDLLQGIVTLPTIYAMNNSVDKDELKQIVATQNMTKEQLARGLSIINETAAIKYSYQVVDDYLTQARNVLPSCLDTEVKEAFNSVADFVQMRDF